MNRWETVTAGPGRESDRVLVWDRGLNTSGSQPIKRVVSGTSNPSSSGTRVDLDEATLMFGKW